MRMGSARVVCPHCGASNSESASWCGRCLEPLGAPVSVPPQAPAAAAIEARPRKGPRNAIGAVFLGVLALVFAGVSWRAVDSVRDNRRLNPLTAPGTLDPRGFLVIEVDPETGRPARYNPCLPLHYVTNLSRAPDGALADVKEAARLTSEASGIEIVYDGETQEVPSGRRPSYLPELYGERWPPILIGWTPHDPSIFKEHDVGVAASDPVENDAGELVYVTGTMILNANRDLSSGFDAGRTWGKVVLHEWGHLLGLDHVANATQVMNASLVSSPARWGTGDEAGLRAVGRSAGCLDEPELP